MYREFEIECALIDAENCGLDGDELIHFAAQSNNISFDDAARVYTKLFEFQNRVAQRLGIQL